MSETKADACTTQEFKGGAQKHATGKLPYHLITREMMDGLARGLNLGIEKGYPARNWEKGLPIHECSLASALRHIFKFIDGEDMNIEQNMKTGEDCTPINHLECALTNLAMAVTQINRGRTDLDDRHNAQLIREQASKELDDRLLSNE